MKRMMWLSMLAACGGTDPDPMMMKPGPVEQRPIELSGACPLEQRVGSFLVEAQERYSLVEGKVADGVVPASIPALMRESPPCRLLKRQNPFCNPACISGETCGLDGTCIPFPAQLDVGTVAISGLEKPIAMEPLPPGNNYFDTDVPHPVFTGGAEIRLAAEGLALEGLGFDVLETDGAPWVVAEGEALSLRWTPAPNARTQIAFRLAIDQHGASPVTLHCTFEDTGEAEVPAELIDALFDSGVSGFPNGALTRETIDSQVVGAGCVELRISSPARGEVQVGGHTPCTGPGQCPAGQTCDLATESCR